MLPSICFPHNGFCPERSIVSGGRSSLVQKPHRSRGTWCLLLVTVYDQRVEKSTENLLESLYLDRLRFAGSVFAYRRMLFKNSRTARMKARKEKIRALKNTTPPARSASSNRRWATRKAPDGVSFERESVDIRRQKNRLPDRFHAGVCFGKPGTSRDTWLSRERPIPLYASHR